MKKCLRGVLCIGLLVVGFMLFKTAPASAAAPGFNIITSPLPIKITAQPGQTITQELRLKNQNDTPEGIKVGLMKFGASGSDGTPDLYSLTPSDTFASWVTFSPSQFTAQPNVWISVTMTIKIPKTADLGYYLAVTYSPAVQPDAPDTTSLKGSAATLVLLDVHTGNEKRSLALSNFSTNHGLYEYLPTTFNIKVHNTGNIYIAPQGNIFIMRGKKTVDTLDFNDAGGSVLPGTNRVFSVPWADGFPVFKDRIVDGKPVVDSHDNPKQDLKWDFSQLSKFRIGKYSAKLLAVYDNGTNDVPLEATVSFWVIPWKIILVLLVILAAIGFGLFTLGRSIYRKARGGAQKIREHAKK